MQEGQNGRRAGLCNASLPALDKIYTSLRPTRPCQSLSALVTTLNLWAGVNAVQPTRTGFKSKEENPGVWECVGAGQTGWSGAQWYIFKNDESFFKKEKINKQKNIVVKAIK